MHKRICFATAFLFVGVQAHAADGFEKIQCGSDIPKALAGQHTSNEPVAAIEARHAALGLKNLGGSDVSDTLFSASWLICGKEFTLLLDERSVVRDALAFPPHSKDAPGFLGACRAGEKDVPGTIIAVLKDEPGSQWLRAQSAWRIDEKSAKFAPARTDDLRCPRDGIFTADGGR